MAYGNVQSIHICIGRSSSLSDLWFILLNFVRRKFYLVFVVAFVLCMRFVFNHGLSIHFSQKNKLRRISFAKCKAEHMICLTFILHFVITKITNVQKAKCPNVQNCKSVCVLLCILYIVRCTLLIRCSFHSFNSIQPKANNTYLNSKSYSIVVHAHELFVDRIAFLWLILFCRCTFLR